MGNVIPPNSFSLSDAYNEAGEPIMSPEQIRAEMAANTDPPEYCDDCGLGHAGPCDVYDDDDDYDEDPD